MGIRTGNPDWRNLPEKTSPIDRASLQAIEDALDASAPLLSPELTGAPTAPTPAPTSNDSTIPTTSWVLGRIPGPELPVITAVADGYFLGTTGHAWTTQPAYVIATAAHSHQLTDLATAKGDSAIAAGQYSQAAEYGDVAFGYFAQAGGGYSVAIGQSQASGYGSVGVGSKGGTVVSTSILVPGPQAVGVGADAPGAHSVGIGKGALPMAGESLAFGSTGTVNMREEGRIGARVFHVKRRTSPYDPFSDYTTGNRTSVVLHDTSGNPWEITVNTSGVISAATYTEPTEIPWTKLTSSPNQTYEKLACSSDGSKAAAAYQSGPIQTTADSGATWTSRTGTGNHIWRGLVMSDDGTKIMAIGDTVSVCKYSSDSGATWSTITLPVSGNYTVLTATSDLSTIYAGIFNGALYKSTDFGATWTTVAAFPTGYTLQTADVAPDGGYLHVALRDATGSNFKVVSSSTAGASWTYTNFWQFQYDNFPSSAIYNVTAANGGVCYIATGGSAWKTTNGGSSWNQINESVGYLAEFATNAAGTKLVAQYGVFGLYFSNGTSWSFINQSTNRTTYPFQWSCVAMSSDGTRAYAALSGGYIYTVALP